MATLTVVEPAIGTDPGFVPADVAGDEYAIDDATVLHVRNDDAASTNVTLASQAGAEPGIAPANEVVPVPAGEARDIRLKPSSRFRDANGRCQVTYSSVTSLSVAVTRIA